MSVHFIAALLAAQMAATLDGAVETPVAEEPSAPPESSEEPADAQRTPDPKATASPPLIGPPESDARPLPTPAVQRPPLGEVGARWAQIGAGVITTGICCIASLAILYVPVVGFAAPVACLLISPSVATLEVWIADLWGPRRGALVWPILAATAAEAFAVVAAVAAPVIYFAIVGFENLSGLNNIGQIGVGIGVAMVTGGVVTMLGVPIAASVAYDLTAIPKDPGDDGTALPGVLLPYQSPTTSGNAAAADASPNAMPRR